MGTTLQNSQVGGTQAQNTCDLAKLCNYISKKPLFFVAGIGALIVIGGILASMGVAMFMYTQYQTNFIETTAGETITVGPVEYTITFEGTHEGDKETQPENTFVMIGITAKYIGNEEKTLLSGGQFYIVDERDQKHEAVYGEFSSKDLLLEWLEPNKPVEKTTQFDIPFDEEKMYKIIVRPQKEQSTVDTAVICITNC